MKEKNGKKTRSFLSACAIALSIVFLVINTTLIFAGFPRSSGFLLFLGGVALVTGLAAWRSARKLGKNFLFMFSVVFCLLLSALFFFSAFSQGKMLHGIFWPVLVLFCGISFFFAGILKKRKLFNFYTVLSGGFLLLGGIFLLFSSEIIPFSFSSVFIYFFPPFVLVFLAVVSAAVNSRKQKERGDGCQVEQIEDDGESGGAFGNPGEQSEGNI